MTKPGEHRPCQACGRPGICATTDWTAELAADDDDDLLTLLADPQGRWLCLDCGVSDRPVEFGTGLQRVDLAAIRLIRSRSRPSRRIPAGGTR